MYESLLLLDYSALGIPDPTFHDRVYGFYKELDQLAVVVEAKEASFDDDEDNSADDPELINHEDDLIDGGT
ncbi:MAG: hypothetical protein Q9176_008104 [Flavoplaca citrina]